MGEVMGAGGGGATWLRLSAFCGGGDGGGTPKGLRWVSLG